MDKFVVSYSPFARSSNDINKMFTYTAVALVLPLVYGVVFFGIQALFVALVCVGVCFLAEILFNLISNSEKIISNASFLVTGLVMADTMPIKMPLYIVAISAFVAIFVVKMVFGGLGKNKFNPALVGRLLAGMCASIISVGLYEFSYNGENYVSFTKGGTNTILNLLTGKAVGNIGTTCIIIILICYAFLVYSSVIDWKIPLFCVLSFLVTDYVLVGMENSILNVCSGSFLFVSVFMMTDPNTSPNSFLGKFVYSVLFGVLSAVCWKLGKMGEDTIFVVALFVNMLVPFFDKYLIIRQKPFGGYRNAYKN